MVRRKLNKQIIILLGPPGSGKGTQGKLLSDELDLYYLETSKIIEKKVMKAKKGEYVEIEGQKYSLIQERKNWQNGKLVSPPLVSLWIKEKINDLTQQEEGILFSGSPRTIYEGEKIIPFLKEIYGIKNIKVVIINLSAEKSIWRNSHRRICSLMRHPILYNKETVKLRNCPLDGSKLIKRKGLDNPDTIRIRLDEYKKRTHPLVGLFKKQDLALEEINGGQTVEKVFKDILIFAK